MNEVQAEFINKSLYADQVIKAMEEFLKPQNAFTPNNFAISMRKDF